MNVAPANDKNVFHDFRCWSCVQWLCSASETTSSAEATLRSPRQRSSRHKLKEAQPCSLWTTLGSRHIWRSRPSYTLRLSFLRWATSSASHSPTEPNSLERVDILWAIFFLILGSWASGTVDTELWKFEHTFNKSKNSGNQLKLAPILIKNSLQLDCKLRIHNFDHNFFLN